MKKKGKKLNRTTGKIELFTSMYLLIFLMVVLWVQIQIKLFMTTSDYVEDALAASNLASAVIDVQEYGKTHVIRIVSPDTAYMLYQEALHYNLNLNENWEAYNKNLIYGKVEILRYEIYNVNKRDITIYSYGEEGMSVREVPGGLGNVYAPDGTMIESTSVYSKIGFPVRGILGLEVAAVKQKTVDIVGNEFGG